ncbi:T-cell surface antigen CD2-like isoform X2 [Pungitius pungitius]|uniref:T-cell surface antigen CD2-like isoform X2 n=1 Tax=Pungitius pungitius TaxID=134920 RepID=UPI002E15CF62
MMEIQRFFFLFRVLRMLVKMAAVFPLAVLLLCCSSVSCAGAPQQCKSYAVTGGTATVAMTIAVQQSDKLAWMHNNSVILRRSKGSFSLGGPDLVTANGSLRLTNVGHDKAGAYKAEVHGADGRIKGTLETSLCVLDPVPKPTVTRECISKVNQVKFTCVDPRQDKGHEVAWLQKDKVLQRETGRTLTRTVDQVKADPVACRLSNRVSSNESAALHHACVDYASFWHRELLGINTWIFVAAGGGVVVLLIIVVIVCCVCNKRRNRMQLEEEGELRLAWTNEKQQHHQHHTCPDHHRQDQQPAGHTGPRQQRSRQQRPGAPEQPRPSPRRPAQAPRPPGQDDEEQPPPLPQPRKNGPGRRRV